MSEVSDQVQSQPFSTPSVNDNLFEDVTNILVPDSQTDQESTQSDNDDLNCVSSVANVSTSVEKEAGDAITIPCSLPMEESTQIEKTQDDVEENISEIVNSDVSKLESTIDTDNVSKESIIDTDIFSNHLNADPKSDPEKVVTHQSHTETILDNCPEVAVLSEKAEDDIKHQNGIAYSSEKQTQVIEDLTLNNESGYKLRHREPNYRSTLGFSNFKKTICDRSLSEDALKMLKNLKEQLDIVQNNLDDTIMDFNNSAKYQSTRSEFLQCLDNTLVFLGVALNNENKPIHQTGKSPTRGERDFKRRSRNSSLELNKEGDTDENSAVTKESLRKAMSKKKAAKRKSAGSTKSPTKKTSPKKVSRSPKSPNKSSSRLRSSQEEEDDDDDKNEVLNSKRKSLQDKLSEEKAKLMKVDAQKESKSTYKRSRNDSESSTEVPSSKSPRNETNEVSKCSIILQDLTSILKNSNFESIRLSDLSRDERKKLLTVRKPYQKRI